MSNYIYVVPEPGTIAPSIAYEAQSIDLYFRIPGAFEIKGTDINWVYEIPMGIKTYVQSGSPGMFMLPRSSASLTTKPKNTTNYFIPDIEGSLDDKWTAADKCLRIYKPTGIRLANTLGYIDADYRGEWIARIITDGEALLDPNKSYFQAIPHDPSYKFKIVSSLEDIPRDIIETTRGAGGFGSSNK